MNYQYVENKCLLCGQDKTEIMGIRGNREYSGADPSAIPHIKTNVVRCTNCGFIYTNPLIVGIEHLEQNHYNDNAQYVAITEGNTDEVFAKRVSIIKKIKSSGKLLDVGAGKGEFLSEAKKAGFECTGAEPSPNFCDYAQKNYGVEMHCGYLGQIDKLKERKFDVITMLHVLEHVENPNELVPALKQNMTDDGILFIEVPNTNSFFVQVIDLYYKVKGLGWSSRLSPLHPPFHKFGYSAASLTYLFKKHNYRILEIKTLHGDRGFTKRKGQNILELYFRQIVTGLVDLLGNRENIYIVVAKN